MHFGKSGRASWFYYFSHIKVSRELTGRQFLFLTMAKSFTSKRWSTTLSLYLWIFNWVKLRIQAFNWSIFYYMVLLLLLYYRIFILLPPLALILQLCLDIYSPPIYLFHGTDTTVHVTSHRCVMWLCSCQWWHVVMQCLVPSWPRARWGEAATCRPAWCNRKPSWTSEGLWADCWSGSHPSSPSLCPHTHTHTLNISLTDTIDRRHLDDSL